MIEQLKTIIESKLLPVVQKPMRYIGGELNCIKKDLSNIDFHGVFCFPDIYDIGMSHFGLQILYHIVNKHDRWAMSRAFQPWTDAENFMRKHSIPLYSLEYFTPVKNADWIGFTIQYELQYTNVINMLDLAGITIFQKERKENEPMIIAGGPCVSNPEPFSPYIDAFAIGDGEKTIVSICEVLAAMKKNNSSRDEKLKELSKIAGIYVPSLNVHKEDKLFVVPDTEKLIRAAKIQQLKNDNYPSKPIVPLMDVIHNRLSVEVMRGCTRGCRFCSAGTYYRPVREREPEQIAQTIQKGVGETGWRDVGLLSLSTADYSCLSSLLVLSSEIKKQYLIALSLPSTRIDALTDEQMKMLDSVSPVSSMTIAPEAGSMRLRKVINKDFSDEEIIATVEKLLANNIQTLKLYFMIGLPTETMDDIEDIISLVAKISGKVRAASKRRSVHVSISPFSPKPHTPFQREQMESCENLLEKGRYIKQSLKHLKNVKVSYRNPQITYLETVMARGDQNVGSLIYEAWKNGAKLDGWDEFFNFQKWVDAANQNEITLSNYVRKIEDTEVLPWQMISTGVSHQFLINERNKAIQQITTSDCRNGNCLDCGVCGNNLHPVVLNEKRSLTNFTQEIQSEKRIEKTDQFLYRIHYSKGENLRFLGHIDMVSIFHRAFQIANIPLAYSNGFNRHAKISFGPPLPLGVAGLNESFDVTTVSQLTTNLIDLNKWLPEGLIIKSVDPVSGKTASINEQIKAAKYHFTFLGNGSIINQTIIESILKRDTIEFVVEKNGQQKVKNLRSGIYQLKMISGNAFEATLAIQDGLTCKPSELIKVLFKDCTIDDFLTSRIQCLEKNNGILKPF